jgi:hypothetical protein
MSNEEITHGLKLVGMVHNMIVARNGGIQRANEESKSAILYYTEFMKEMGVQNGFFKLTLLDATMFVLGKTALKPEYMADKIEDYTSFNLRVKPYPMYVLFGKLYIQMILNTISQVDDKNEMIDLINAKLLPEIRCILNTMIGMERNEIKTYLDMEYDTMIRTMLIGGIDCQTDYKSL